MAKRNKHFSKLFVTTIILAISCGISISIFISNLPDISDLENYKYNPSLITRILADDGTVMREFYKMQEFYKARRISVALKEIPNKLVEAVIATEDKDFYKHYGVDIYGILRALWKNIMAKRIVQGGSTITQQLVKLLFLTPKRSLTRKIKESILALKVESRYSKEEILNLYFNHIYFGHGVYGVGLASQIFFNKNVKNLNLAECAYLAGIPAAPTHYSPFKYPQRVKKRQEYVLKRMLLEGYITNKEYILAKNFPISLSIRGKRRQNTLYFTEYIRQYLENQYYNELINYEGLRIYTTLNINFQEAANIAVEKGLKKINDVLFSVYKLEGIIRENTLEKIKELKEDEELRGQVVESNVKRLVIEFFNEKQIIEINPVKKEVLVASLPRIGEIVILKKIKTDETKKLTYVQISPSVQVSLIAIEPSTGHIKVMVSGCNFSLTPFNRTIYAKRQAGSSFKVFVYTTALASNFTPISIIDDSPISFYNKRKNEYWTPQNYERKIYGPVTLRKALAESINIVAVKLLKEVGVENAIQYAHRMGIKSFLSPDLSLALGSSVVSNLEMTNSYATLATYGVYVPAIFFSKIEKANGTLFKINKPKKERVLSEQLAYMMISMLQSPVKDGTCQIAKSLNRPVCAKTGTTNEFTDAWFIGFTPQLVCGVWVGYDKIRTMGKMFTGAKAAGSIWVDFMSTVLKNAPVEDFYIPPGISFVKIDKETNLLATDKCNKESIVEEIFFAGSEPREFCNIH